MTPSIPLPAVREILTAGTLAPTAHNAQPWRFRIAGDAIELRRDPAWCFEHLDFEHGATYVGLGAALENIVIAASTRGLRADVELFPDPAGSTRVATLTLRADPAARVEGALAAAIATRCTNRRLTRRAPLAAGDRPALEAAAASAGATLLIVDAPAELARLGRLVGRAERFALQQPAVHREVFGGMRWTPEEARAVGRGLDVATLELGRADRAAVRLLARPGAPRMIERLGLGTGLEMMGRKTLNTASAVGLLVHPGLTPPSYVAGGRALQRVWLTATTRDVGVYPLATLPYFLARADRGGAVGLSPAATRAFRALRAPCRALFPTPDGHAEILLLRFSKAPPPSARSVRVPLDAVLDSE